MLNLTAGPSIERRARMSSSDESMDDGLIEILDRLARGRRYASFFESIDKAAKEMGVAESFASAILDAEGTILRGLAAASPDPPDIFCVDAHGGRVAVEISEIVCKKAVEANEVGKQVFRIWRPGELRDAIAAALARKDSKKYHGGPYSRVYACFFTDEMMLTPEAVREELQNVTFGPCRTVTDAFLLFSYREQHYPLLRLVLA